ncbi:hypothetical protein BDV96DRAFT_653478 [Lophiotrema nucula]|uniref:F-box domain-containing protein n=1 Tax=Lophiotrema nucula TaxID=690887 RepID=A0A6A5YKR6_9PLEO|nr:hypothetical protein BDV96DRAFT_653478 [Lophiotrema nucula]
MSFFTKSEEKPALPNQPTPPPPPRPAQDIAVLSPRCSILSEKSSKRVKMPDEQHSQVRSFRYFLALPRELRDEIYKHAIDDKEAVLTSGFHTHEGWRRRYSRIKFPACCLPGFCYASEKMSREGTPLFIQRCTFDLDTPQVLLYLHKTKQSRAISGGLRNIRSLKIDSYLWYTQTTGSREECAEAAKIICALPQLEDLTIKTYTLDRDMERNDFCLQVPRQDVFSSLDEIIYPFKSHELLYLRSVRSISFSCEPNVIYQADRSVEFCKGILGTYVTWLRLQFLASGKKPDEVGLSIV